MPSDVLYPCGARTRRTSTRVTTRNSPSHPITAPGKSYPSTCSPPSRVPPNHHATGDGQKRTTQTRPRSARDDGHVQGHTQFDHLRDFFGVPRQDDRVGRIFFERVSVTLVDEQLVRLVDYSIVAYDCSQFPG